MKRTKQRFAKLEGYNNKGISSCKVFDGEDLEYQDRFKLQQFQQKNWIEQQKFEKDAKLQEERNEEKAYAEQTLAINRMRAMLEAEHEQKRKDMNRMMMEYNKNLDRTKKDRDRKHKMEETNMDSFNIDEAEKTRSVVYFKLKAEIDQAKTSI
jgi:hypothetical protein